jgi:hypothetical protein
LSRLELAWSRLAPSAHEEVDARAESQAATGGKSQWDDRPATRALAEPLREECADGSEDGVRAEHGQRVVHAVAVEVDEVPQRGGPCPGRQLLADESPEAGAAAPGPRSLPNRACQPPRTQETRPGFRRGQREPGPRQPGVRPRARRAPSRPRPPGIGRGRRRR